jgi:hypothetical protein
MTIGLPREEDRHWQLRTTCWQGLGLARNVHFMGGVTSCNFYSLCTVTFCNYHDKYMYMLRFETDMFGMPTFCDVYVLF